MDIKITRNSITSGVLIASTVGLMVLVFGIFEDAVGHGIAVASLAATTTIVVFQSRSRAGRPATIVFGYTAAAAIGVMTGFLPEGMTLLQVAVGVVALIIILTAFDRMHPPSVAYLFGFILGDYGFIEFFVTLMALVAFFVSLAVIVFILEEVLSLLGLTEKERKEPEPKTFLQAVEQTVDRMVPFFLVLLFFSILSQFLYPEFLEPYGTYLEVFDWIIIGLLVVDLVFKFIKTSTTKNFIRKYWIEIIAVLPFFLVFRTLQGFAVAVRFLTGGALVIPVGSQVFIRFIRPMARFPRFIRMLDNLDRLTGLGRNP